MRVSRNDSRACTDEEAAGRADHGRMSYAVIWTMDGGAPHAGKLSLTASAVVLEGSSGRAPARLELPYAAIASARIARTPAERIEHRPIAILESELATVRFTTVGGVGALTEIVELVDGHRADSHAVAAC